MFAEQSFIILRRARTPKDVATGRSSSDNVARSEPSDIVHACSEY